MGDPRLSDGTTVRMWNAVRANDPDLLNSILRDEFKERDQKIAALEDELADIKKLPKPLDESGVHRIISKAATLKESLAKKQRSKALWFPVAASVISSILTLALSKLL